MIILHHKLSANMLLWLHSCILAHGKAHGKKYFVDPKMSQFQYQITEFGYIVTTPRE